MRKAEIGSTLQIHDPIVGVCGFAGKVRPCRLKERFFAAIQDPHWHFKYPSSEVRLGLNKRLLLPLALVCLLSFPAPRALAQGFGTIVGIVTDPSGAVVPSAKVTVTEVGTGFTRTVTTEAQGNYAVPQLRPTNYTLTVTAQGFTTYIRNDITLQADQSATVNVRLALGSTAQSVTVRGGAPPVNTSTQTLETVVDQARIVDLPLNGRNAAQLTALAAGAVVSTNTWNTGAIQASYITQPGALVVSANGSEGNQTSYNLDGGNNMDTYTNVNLPFPFPDALQEFSYQTSDYSAQYGENAGGVVNIVTKSGTNQLHGDLFGFARNDVFNARGFFQPKRNFLDQAQFGGTVGGPVMIPGLYNGRDKTFFFFGAQATTARITAQGLHEYLPTPAEMNGDFSAYLNASNPGNLFHQVIKINNPFTGQPFAGNIIPTSLYNSTSLAYLKYFPLSTADPTTGYTVYTSPAPTDQANYIFRVDHSISSTDKLMFRWNSVSYTAPANSNPANIASDTNGSADLSENFLFQQTYNFRPNMLNTFRFSYTRDATTQSVPPNFPSAASLGIQGVYNGTFPAIKSLGPTGYFSAGIYPLGLFRRNDFAWSDDVSWVRGRHNISFGGDIERSRVDTDNENNQDPSFQIVSNTSNNAMASFLLGYIRGFSQGMGTYLKDRNTFTGVYFNDSWKVTRRLTLNYGLRYEPFFPWYDTKYRNSNFYPQDYGAGIHSAVFPNAPSGLLFPGDAGVPHTGAYGDFDNFAPRIGFAFDPTGSGKTSIRGGAGIFYDSRQLGGLTSGFGSQAPWTTKFSVASNLIGPLNNPLNGAVNPLPVPSPPPQNVVFPTPLSITVYNATPQQVPRAYNWNLTIEHELAPNWLLRVSYVGHAADHLMESVQLDPALQITCPGGAPITSCNTSANETQRKMFPGYGSILWDSYDINSNYNAAQVTLQKRFSHGSTILATYTWSRGFDGLPSDSRTTTIGAGGESTYPWFYPQNRSNNYGPSFYDAPQNLVVSYVWDVPWFAHSPSRWTRDALWGWELSGILTVQSGMPVSQLESSADQSLTGIGDDRAFQIPGINPYISGSCTPAPCVNWLNPAALTLAPLGTFGNIGKSEFYGPGIKNWDVGLFRKIKINERWSLQFRAEFFNVVNHPNFAEPDAGPDDASFGQIRGTSTGPRIGQLALKVFF